MSKFEVLLRVEGSLKNLPFLQMKKPSGYWIFSKVRGFSNCASQRDIPRTLDRMLDSLIKLNDAGKLPDLSQLAAVQRNNTSDEESGKKWKHDERGKFMSL